MTTQPATHNRPFLTQLRPDPTRPQRQTITVEEAAIMIGISKNAAYECIRRGEIPAKHFGRRIVILRSDITALLTADNEHEN